MRFLCIVLNLHNGDVNECAIYSCKNRATCIHGFRTGENCGE